MRCPSCQHENEEGADACFNCGKALHVLTRGTVLADRYAILIPLGQGGMGRVYMAHDRTLDEAVAIKVLRGELVGDPDITRRFLSEIRLARKISHRNVCRIHEYGQDHGVRFLSMEFVDGITLKELLDKRQLSVAEAYDIAFQVARGLEAVHGAGIIHRDFKAANIMIDRRGVVRLMDFGIAKEMEAAARGTTTTTGHVVGTPEYMSPEQVQGRHLDFRSDIYSLGCVVYEIFAGHAAFHGENTAATLYKHLHDPPLLKGPDSGIPDVLAPVLERALAKEREGRFADVGEFLVALSRARGGPTPEASEPAEASDLRRHVDALHRQRTSALTGLPPAPGEEKATHTLFPRGLTRATRRAQRLALFGAIALGVAVGVVAWWIVRPPVPDPGRFAAGPIVSPRAPAGSPLAAAESPARPSPPPELPATGPPARRAAGEPATEASRADEVLASPPPVASLASRRAGRNTGMLRVLIVPPSEVSVDGLSMGLISLREVPLPAGPHVVRVIHPDYEPLQRRVTVQAGITTKLILDLAEKGIRKQP